MVVVKKSNGDLRLCLDPTDLNKVLKKQHFQVPSVQEIFARVGKARYFSTLDAIPGFLQVPLHEKSTYLATMATPFGRYRYLRLPFGLASAPEAYKHIMVFYLEIYQVWKLILMIF